MDVHTVRKLDDMARQRDVSASEALREAIELASLNNLKKPSSALKALDNLQSSLKLTSAKARAWAGRARAERRASSSTRRSQAMIQLDMGSLIRAMVRNTPQDIKFRSWLRSRPSAGISRGLIAMSVLG
ncbi:MAG: hypothetical protein ACXWZQ_20685 [Candidatus Binatia bacterium]